MLERILHVERNEARSLYLLLLYAVVMGLAYAFLYTASTSLFLAEFHISFLPYTYVAGGLLSYLLWILFSQFSKRSTFSKQLVGGAAFLMLSTAVLTFAYLETGNRYFTFVLVLWLNVFMFINGVGFYGITSKIYNIQDSKRFFGIISSGEVFSKVVSFFSVPFIINLFPVRFLLHFAVVGFGLCLVLMVFIIRSLGSRLDVQGVQGGSPASQDSDLRNDLRNKYHLYILWLAVLPLFSAYYVDFGFLTITQNKFESVEDVGRFLGTFLGFMTIIEFLVKSLISIQFINRYGILFTLLVLPMLLLVVSVLAAMGSISSLLASLLFSLFALNKLLIRVLRTSFVDPSFQILYQVVPLDRRSALQAKVEGLSKSSGSILAGLLLILISHVVSLDLVYHNYILIAVAGIWIWLSYLVYQEYRNTLKSMLNRTSKEEIESGVSDALLYYGLDRADDPVRFRVGVTLLENVDPAMANYLLLRLLPKSSSDIQRLILEIIEQKSMLPAKRIIDLCLKNSVPEELRKYYLNTSATLEEAGKQSIETLTQVVHSGSSRDRQKVAELLAYYENYNAYKVLKELLNDGDKYVRNAALIASGKKKHRELWPYIIRNIANPESSFAATTAVKMIGEPILHTLFDQYHRENMDSRVQEVLIRLSVEIGGKKATRFLLSRRYLPDDLKEQLSRSLVRQGYKVAASTMLTAKGVIEDSVRMVVWLAAAILDVQPHDQDGDLLQALEQELNLKRVNIFLHLSMMYDSSATGIFIQNSTSLREAAEVQAYAIEVLDLTVPADVKSLILPLVSGLSYSDLVRQYAERFPQQQLTYSQRLLDIINKDYLSVGRFTKSCALLLAATQEGAETCIAASIQSHDVILKETALWVLYQHAPQSLQEKVNRLDAGERKAAGVILRKFENKSYLIGLAVIHRLKRIFLFQALPNPALIKLAEASEQVYLPAASDHCSTHDQRQSCFVILTGQVQVMKEDVFHRYLDQGELYWLFDEKDYVDGRLRFMAQKDTVLLVVDSNLMYEMVSQYKQMAKAIVDTTQERVAA